MASCVKGAFAIDPMCPPANARPIFISPSNSLSMDVDGDVIAICIVNEYGKH